jgi:hypothetical protein
VFNGAAVNLTENERFKAINAAKNRKKVEKLSTG